MTLCVYTVDKTTRLVMPNSQWARSVLAKLTEMGHQVELTGEDPAQVQQTRSVDELEKAMEIIDSTGM